MTRMDLDERIKLKNYLNKDVKLNSYLENTEYRKLLEIIDCLTFVCFLETYFNDTYSLLFERYCDQQSLSIKFSGHSLFSEE